LRIECENSLAGRIENHFAERHPPQLSIFIEKPRDQLVDRILRRSFFVCERNACEQDGEK